MTPNDLIAAFEVLADAPDGVKRLRELVLSLAVRGKLVAQDPADESATGLLNQIAAERLRGVNSTKAKQSLLWVPVSGDEVPFDLPSAWVWARVGWLGPTQTGATPKVDATALEGPRIPFVRPNDIHWAGVDSDRELISRSTAEATRRIAKPGAVLMVCIGTIGKTARCITEATFNQQINAVQVLLASSEFIAWAFRSPFFQRACWSAASATTLSILNKGKWEALPVPLPPLAEQHRIVARVDELMGLLDRLEAARATRDTVRRAARDAALADLRDAPDAESVEAAWGRIARQMEDLFTDPEDVGPLRQAVLSLAVRGKLVPQDAGDEPASVLMRKIAAHFPQPTKGRRAREEVGSADSGEVEPPPGWASAPLGSIAQVIRGITFPASAKNRQPGEGLVPCLRTTNVQNRITWDDLLYVSTEHVSRVEQYLRVDDIVMSMANSRELVGKVALNDRDTEGVTFGGFLAVIRPVLVVPRFLMAVLRTTTAREGLIDSATQTTNIANISLGRLNPFIVPLPPLAEQHRIVAKVDALMALCDALEARLTAARALHGQFAAAAVHHLDA
jgi:type I restriction enzyme S subunit